MAKRSATRLPPDSITARDLLAQTSLVSRRSLRRRGGFVVYENQEVALDGSLPLTESWTVARYVHWELRWRMAPAPVVLLHKPLGMVTSRKEDGGHPTVFAALVGHPAAEELQPVGRLDVETSGTLLFTSDGELLHRLTHPRRQIERCYRTELAAVPDNEGLAALRRGDIELRDGHTPLPLRIAPWPDAPATTWEVVLTEGKYHEVRRMFAAIGAPVVALHRVHHAGVSCDAPLLPPGDWRDLSDEERLALYARVGLTPPPPSLQVVWERVSEGENIEEEDDEG